MTKTSLDVQTRQLSGSHRHMTCRRPACSHLPGSAVQSTCSHVRCSFALVQVTFLNAASTPRELKLLHAPTLASTFRLIPVHVTISAQDASRQLQHSITVGSNIPVQRFLKVEMSGLAIDSAAGEPCQIQHAHTCMPPTACTAGAVSQGTYRFYHKAGMQVQAKQPLEGLIHHRPAHMLPLLSAACKLDVLLMGWLYGFSMGRSLWYA